MVNSSPFLYSLGLMSYRPLAGGTTSIGVTPSFSGGECVYSQSSDQSLMVKTQYPHCFFKPQKSEGCEMVLPFIYPSPWINLKDSNLDSLKVMGTVYLEAFQLLLNSSGTAVASPINISIYVWASDVELSGPSLCLQSATHDEYADRPVSTVASSVAAAAGALSRVPVIGPYMRATQMISSSIGSVAHWFGFSNPPVIDPVRAVTIKPCINLCSPEIATQIDKIALDPKNELNIDPSTVGCDSVDAMAFKHIQDRDVCFNRFTWLPTDSYDAPLFSALVTPVNFFNILSTSPTNVKYIATQMTPGALLAQNFEYWRGSIKYRFIIAASAFHRGRIRVLFDPNGPSAVSPYTVPRVHQAIWDISESDTFDFEVPFMASTPWLETDATPATGQSTITTSTIRAASPAMPYSSTFHNGYIQLSVLNELTSAAGGTVTISCFVNTADVEYASPKYITAPGTEMLLYAPKSASVSFGVSPTKDTSTTMGESVTSIRSLIHRSVLWDEIVPQLIPGSNAEISGFNINYNTPSLRKILSKWIIPRLPLPRHYSQLSAAPSTIPVDGSFPWSTFSNAANSTLYVGSNSRTLPVTLFAACYVGWRGSIVWRAFNTAQTHDIYSQYASLSLQPERAHWATIKPKDTNWIDIRSDTNLSMSHGFVTAVASYAAPTSNAALLKASQIASNVATNACNGLFGVARNETAYSPSVEAVFPHYSPLFMLPSNNIAYQNYLTGPTDNPEFDTMENYGINVSSSDTISLQRTMQTGYTSNGVNANPSDFCVNNRSPVAIFASAGPDFSMFQFLAVPTLFRVVSVPAAVTPWMGPLT